MMDAKITPMKSIRNYCVKCCNGYKEVLLCPVEDCPLWSLRFGKGVLGVSPLDSIRGRCLDCSVGSTKDVRECKIVDCEIYPYRFGHNPKLIGKRGNSRSLENLLSRQAIIQAEETEQDERAVFANNLNQRAPALFNSTSNQGGRCYSQMVLFAENS
jgi:hypothetical protein